MRGDSDRCAYGVAIESRLGRAYNEEAFRYFLEIERKRTPRLGRPCLLLLAGLKNQAKPNMRIEPAIAARLFSGLWQCLRETDVIGWYREDRVAGALLTQLADGPLTDVSRLIRQRVSEALCHGLRPGVARRLNVHVYELRPKLKA
jgi:hypothetical protein